jgi:hypothetical protein
MPRYERFMVPVNYFVFRDTDKPSFFVPFVLQTFYVDDTLRITRDIDDNFFVFARA